MTIMNRRNRQRVTLLYIFYVVVVVASVIVATNNDIRHGDNNSVDNSASEASATTTTSSGEQDDGVKRLPLHLQHRWQDELSLDDSDSGVLHTESHTRNNKRQSSSKGDNELLRRHYRHDHYQDPQVGETAATQSRGEEDDNLIMMMTSSSSIHSKSTADENIHTAIRRRPGRQQRSSHRRLNRGPDKDVMKAIEEDRSELEQILGHPIYHAKSSKPTDDEAKWAGDSWTEGSSTVDPWASDPWTGDPWTGSRSDTWSSGSWAGDDSRGLQTGWSDDGWNFNEQYKTDLDHLRADIVQLIEDTERELLPKCLRLAFHDCIGGCDGCIDPTVLDNRGLNEPVELLFPLVQKYQHKFSRADVWAYCAVIATDMAVVENRPDDLHFYMHYVGRKDCDGADEKGFGGPVVGKSLSVVLIVLSLCSHTHNTLRSRDVH